jgi:hypothetical protein
MGLIRKSLYLGTGGLVSPNSKKQRMQMKQLTAMQGGTAKEIQRAGGRYDFRGFWGITEPQSAENTRRGLPAEGPVIRTVAGVITEVRPDGRRCHDIILFDKEDQRHLFVVPNKQLPVDDPAELTGCMVVVTSNVTQFSVRVTSVDVVKRDDN